jgi:hypothetical protein
MLPLLCPLGFSKATLPPSGKSRCFASLVQGYAPVRERNQGFPLSGKLSPLGFETRVPKFKSEAFKQSFRLPGTVST